MTDIAAAIGLIELKRYDADTLVRRKEIFDQYTSVFKNDKRFNTPIYSTGNKQSCYHLYPLRINNISEAQRDLIIKEIFDQDVSVNVHFIPVPAMSFYKGMGYDVHNYPVTYKNYSCEISLPVFYDLDKSKTKTVIDAVINAINKVLC
jgi:dTDP-4-amino-4,6-dideoxygalactose transaminase